MKTKFIYVMMAALLIGSQTISAQNKDNKDQNFFVGSKAACFRQSDFFIQFFFGETACFYRY